MKERRRGEGVMAFWGSGVLGCWGVGSSCSILKERRGSGVLGCWQFVLVRRREEVQLHGGERREPRLPLHGGLPRGSGGGTDHHHREGHRGVVLRGACRQGRPAGLMALSLLHTYIHTYTHTYLHTYIHNTYTQHTYIHAYILHTYIHTYIHTSAMGLPLHS